MAMIYRSNLTCPDLTPYFKHTVSRPMPHSFGHDVLSDWGDKADDDPIFGIYKRCGFWTHDEVAILYNIAKQLGGRWLDIGGHTGWTAAHVAAAGCEVHSIEPMYRGEYGMEWNRRLIENFSDLNGQILPATFHAIRSDEFFAVNVPDFKGVVIDGDHDRPHPLNDAIESANRSNLILFHDAIGEPAQEGIRYLVEHGFNLKIYETPHVVACCWHGDFEPPHHVPDPRVSHGIRPHIQPLIELQKVAAL